MVAITTFDNPYNPLTDFSSWYQFDMDKGYNTCGYLDRIAKTSDSLSDEENRREVERAIDEIIRFDVRNIYRKVNSEEQPEAGTN